MNVCGQKKVPSSALHPEWPEKPRRKIYDCVVDGLTGFPQAPKLAFQTEIQQASSIRSGTPRNLLHKEIKPLYGRSEACVYAAPTEEVKILQNWTALIENGCGKYPKIGWCHGKITGKSFNAFYIRKSLTSDLYHEHD